MLRLIHKSSSLLNLEKRHFIQIIDQNKGAIRSLCKVYYTCKEDQKDAFQDIILQLWKSFDSFRGQSKIHTWIYRVGLNTILSKKRKETPTVSLDLEVAHSYPNAVGADDNLEVLHLIIHSLKDLDKAIVVLHLEGYRHKEIAEMLMLSPTNVATRFNRIKTQLKTKINTQESATKRS